MVNTCNSCVAVLYCIILDIVCCYMAAARRPGLPSLSGEPYHGETFDPDSEFHRSGFWAVYLLLLQLSTY